MFTPGIATPGAPKSIWPAIFKQMLSACFFCRKFLLKLQPVELFLLSQNPAYQTKVLIGLIIAER